MPAKNHKQWKIPAFEQGDYVDSRIYSDQDIFDEEQEKIFKQVWIPVCHESELPESYDFRTTSIAKEPIILVRGQDNEVRAFLNVCPHRGMRIERRTAGNFAEGQPSGNPKHMTCMFHAWQFDMKGNCVDIPRATEGYQDRLSKENVGLRRLRCEVRFGGFVWVTLNDKVEQDLETWADGAFECIRTAIDTEPLEVFHYHKAIIDSNYKLWHDTNSEFYHDYMHYHNRVTGFNDEYFARTNKGFKNGHVNVNSFTVQYGEFELGESREDLSFPGFPPNQWYMIDLFPGMNFNLRGSALRCDIVTPLGPNKVMIEFRGLGLKSDSKKDRKTRIEHHNSIWGPFGRNLHEDLLGITGQGASMQTGSEPRRILHGRHENSLIHDEIGMRHFYSEWSKWMGRNPSDPMNEQDKVLAAE